MQDFKEPNTFVFTCHRCKSPLFQLKHGGIVECMNCSRAYAYLSAADNWVPITMDAEMYLEKYLNKAWDEEKKAFRNIDEIKKDEENKKPVKSVKKKGDKNNEK